MKPLKFKDVSPNRILNYEAMSKIRGGAEGAYHDWGTGTCGIKYWVKNEYSIHCNMSFKEMELIIQSISEKETPPYWWCCDSCATTTYCDEAAGGGY